MRRKKPVVHNAVGRGAQTYLEFALFVAIAVAAMLIVQNYFKRSMQGQLQLTVDQMATPYAPALMNSNEHFASNSRVIELETAGWGHPTTVTRTRVNYNADSNKVFKPLGATLVPKEQE
ncbi:MAG: hypothetical protein PHQ96_04065 [Candidatus Omnitrophica bacterium]|nr:hypothetical protein [Candidatus Omnitrophota bacterium]